MPVAENKYAALSRIVIAVIALKLVLIAAILLFFNDKHVFNQWNLWFLSADKTPSALLPLSFWDGQHYLFIAKYGYMYVRCFAFFPLYPDILSAVNLIAGNLYSAGLIVSFLFSIFTAVYLYSYFSSMSGRTAAYPMIIAILCSPPAFFLSVFYSETIFLFLLAGLAFYIEKRSRAAFLFIIPLVFCKGNAMFVFVSMLMLFAIRTILDRKADRFYAGAVLMFVFGYALFFFYFYLITDSLTYILDVQGIFIFKNSLVNILSLKHFISFISSMPASFFDYSNSILDKSVMILFMLSTYFVLKTRNIRLVSFYVPLVFIPALMGEGASYFRHSLSALPFLLASLQVCYGIRRFYFYTASAIMLVIQLLIAVRWASNLWVN